MKDSSLKSKAARVQVAASPGSWGRGAVWAALVLLAAAALLVGCQSETAVTQGQGTEESPVVLDAVTTSGTGKVLASPDEALLYVTVETQASEAAAAVDENAQRMESVIQRLEEEGVPEEAIQTSNVTVFPEARHDPETNRMVTDSYRATNTVQVTLRELERVGEIYSAAVEAGANNVRGPEWRLSEDSVAVQEALKKAAAAARGKAEALAEAEGLAVGEVVVMHEDAASIPPVFFGRGEEMAMDEAALAQTPVNPQDLEVTASVTITYRLDR
ncbi:MAG: hypothetical protein Kow00129_12080 [Thermoleophilia bacterium]